METEPLTLYEINAAVRALAGTYIIHPRSEQQNAADRAYYKLLAMADAARSATGRGARMADEFTGSGHIPTEEELAQLAGFYEAGEQWTEPWCEEHRAAADPDCRACLGASHDAWMHRAKAAEAHAERLRQALDGAWSVAGRFMLRPHVGFEYEEISQALAEALQELSVIHRAASAALQQDEEKDEGAK